MGKDVVATIDMHTGYAYTQPQSISPFGQTKSVHSGQLKLDLNFRKGIMGGGIHTAVLFRGEERFMAGGHAQFRGRLFGKLSAYLSIGAGVSVNVHENAEVTSRYAIYLMPALGLQIMGKKVGVGLSVSVPIFIGDGHTPATVGCLVSLTTSFRWTKGANKVVKKVKSPPKVVASKK